MVMIHIGMHAAIAVYQWLLLKRFGGSRRTVWVICGLMLLSLSYNLVGSLRPEWIAMGPLLLQLLEGTQTRLQGIMG